MSFLRCLTLWLVILTATSRFAFCEVIPVPALTGPIIDQVGVLPPEIRQELERELWALKRDKGSEVTVLVVASTQPEEIEQFSIRVVSSWKLGRKNIDDGVLLLVALNDRRVRIEVGRGLEGDIPDVKAFRIIEEIILPRFKEGNIPGGISAGVRAIEGLLRGLDLPKPVQGGEETSGWGFLLTVLGYGIGNIAEAFVGLAGGTLIATTITLFIGLLVLPSSSAFVFAALVAVLILVLAVARNSPRGGGYTGRSPSRSPRGAWHSSRSLGGGSFGGGGSFSGGGASGRW